MIIFDLDGTLADCEHRRHFVQQDKIHLGCLCQPVNRICKKCQNWKPDWKAFYEACDQDEIIWPVKSMFVQNCHRDIQIWSGRCESVRKKTICWIYNHTELSEKFIDSILKMRPIGDSTPDDKLKEKWLDEAFAQGKTIDFVFDDRPKVIRMYRQRGIFVFNCCQHDQEF